MSEKVEHGNWSRAEVPHKGWVCVGVEDLEEPSEVCEMCRTAVIRYVHTMAHPGWPGQLRCGCVCAEHMSEDYVGPRERENALKARARQRAHWLDRKGWKRSEKGWPYINAGAWNVVVFRVQGRWTFRISDRVNMGLCQSPKTFFEDANGAALAAFDMLPAMKQRLREARRREEVW